MYNAIRKRELDELYTESEIKDSEGKIILKVSDVHYSIESDKKDEMQANTDNIIPGLG
ncbi:MAG: hypothetical protein WCR55_14000 [Lentisphaerota bacterium]